MYNRGTMNRLLQAILDLSKLLYTKDLFCRIHFLTLLPIYLKTYIDKIPWDHLPHFPCSCLFFITTSTFLPLPFLLSPNVEKAANLLFESRAPLWLVVISVAVPLFLSNPKSFHTNRLGC